MTYVWEWINLNHQMLCALPFILSSLLFITVQCHQRNKNKRLQARNAKQGPAHPTTAHLDGGGQGKNKGEVKRGADSKLTGTDAKDPGGTNKDKSPSPAEFHSKSNLSEHSRPLTPSTSSDHDAPDKDKSLHPQHQHAPKERVDRVKNSTADPKLAGYKTMNMVISEFDDTEVTEGGKMTPPGLVLDKTQKESLRQTPTHCGDPTQKDEIENNSPVAKTVPGSRGKRTNQQ